MATKTNYFIPKVRPSRLNYLGLLFSLIGFVLVILCLSGGHSKAGQSLHFLKITDNPPSQLAVTYGWRGYCINDKTWQCKTDDSMMVVPFDVAVSDMLNGTYPELFENAIPQDPDLNPLAGPNPPHDPKIFAAAVLCLLCGGSGLTLGLLRTMGRGFEDKHYGRGFLCCAAAVLALLLVAECSVMYANAATQLTREYPQLIATQGPGLPMMGVAFGSFVLAGFCFLQGCFSKEDSYRPI
ncbi:hypothetical protein J3Q64DRAFT_1730070 [Phycomyces blakesleeanus]|uniref:Uncharacterized protein n=2 Tax=Phycomyces blakesleeanus TaxID=4837 RepID=A0A167NJS5_PHYB8|nr:hypothetical protein PHYBLDRAFT_166063 [Phycomyces blakesleeanus NRRL 1555(-)]OAD76090.1 hypothetical protein PHYBLDRAFT_166063 [Phycomyces blakesleeanus NRRL 1555(-)]|eukprot:XP_018294130.1 hypothetical protein PHYBLDRAFT_166063 [Phycomyces blakesleeanus NRRL 1555(-)]